MTLPMELLDAWTDLLRLGQFPGGGHMRLVHAAVNSGAPELRHPWVERLGRTNAAPIGILPARSVVLTDVQRPRGKDVRVTLYVHSSPALPPIGDTDDWGWLAQLTDIRAGDIWKEDPAATLMRQKVREDERRHRLDP